MFLLAVKTPPTQSPKSPVLPTLNGNGTTLSKERLKLMNTKLQLKKNEKKKKEENLKRQEKEKKQPKNNRNPEAQPTPQKKAVPASGAPEEKKPRTRKPKEGGAEKSSSRRRDKPERKKTEKPSALTSVIYPALDKLSDVHSNDDRLVASLQHLKTTFDNAERAQPGVTHALIVQIIDTLKKSQA